ncbi:MAG: DUF423 domain-containing protein [Candidatus Kariarchaeaceae archaeon]
MTENGLDSNNLWLLLGSIFSLLAVMLGAFGAHILEDRIDADDMKTFETAVRYHMYHGLALILVAILSIQTQAKQLNIAGWAFTVGILLFSGSLYILAITGIKWLGAITPLGGVAFITGWSSLAYLGYNSR